MKEHRPQQSTQPPSSAESEPKKPGAHPSQDRAWAQNRIRNHFAANKSSPYVAPKYEWPEHSEHHKPSAQAPDGDKASAQTSAQPAVSGDKPVTPASGGAAEEAPPIGDDELIIMRNQMFARNYQVPHYQQSVGSMITPWGLSFDPATVHLAQLAPDTNAIALTWRPDWGTKPSMREIPPTFSPIEARAAQKGITLLKGWSKVERGDQNILSELIGGETNDLSIRARMNLKPKMATLPSQPEEEQAKALKGVISDKAAQPFVANEEVSVKPVEVTLTGPKILQGYAFPGKKADAESWTATYSDGAVIEIIAPKAPDPAYHQHSVNEAADAARYLPAGNRKLLNTILLSIVENPADKEWAVEYNMKNFHSYMTSGAAGVVTVYPSKTHQAPSAQKMRSTMIHESGHTWAMRTWGEDETKGKYVDWRKAMDADKASVSGYAQADIGEDIAETIGVYGAVKGTKKYDEYEAIVPHRFAMLKKELK